MKEEEEAKEEEEENEVFLLPESVLWYYSTVKNGNNNNNNNNNATGSNNGGDEEIDSSMLSNFHVTPITMVDLTTINNNNSNNNNNGSNNNNNNNNGSNNNNNNGSNSSKEWCKFSAHDCLLLELTYRALKKPVEWRETSSSSSLWVTSGMVPVKNSLYHVHIPKRIMVSTYWASAPVEVRRATWFVKENETTWLPVPEYVSDVLEDKFVSEIWKTSLPHSFNVIGGLNLPSYEITMYSKTQIYLFKQDMTSRTIGFLKETFFGSDKKANGLLVRRGMIVSQTATSTPKTTTSTIATQATQAPTINLSENINTNNNDGISDPNTPVDHLVFVIHGIGQKMESVNINDNVAALRNSIAAHLTNPSFLSSTNSVKKTTTNSSSSNINITSSQTSSNNINNNNNNNNSNNSNTNSNDAVFKDDAGSRNIEFFPIQWRKNLQLWSPEDVRLEEMTLPGVPQLRGLINDVVLDVLFYLSSKYSHLFIKSALTEINRVYNLYTKYNPEFLLRRDFRGKVSIIGHSLGSVIAFDMVSQCFTVNSIYSPPSQLLSTNRSLFSFNNNEQQQPEIKEEIASTSSTMTSSTTSSTVPIGALHHIAPLPYAADQIGHLDFEVDTLFCLGSPLGLFLSMRGSGIGIRSKAEEKSHINLCFPRVRRMINIANLYDPVCFRIEPLVYLASGERFNRYPKPAYIPFHKGGHRLHIEMASNFEKMTNAFKVFNDFSFLQPSSSSSSTLSASGNKLLLTSGNNNNNNNNSSGSRPNNENENQPQLQNSLDNLNDNTIFGLFHQKRLDFVLQDSPTEITYMSAVTSHMSYWPDPDISLFIFNRLISTSSGVPIVNSSIPQKELTSETVK